MRSVSILYPLIFVICIISYSQSVPGTTGSKLNSREAQEALDFHNEVRKEVNCPALKWSDELAKYAQEWAAHLAENCDFQHRPNSGKWAQKYGENIFWGAGEDYTALHASESWYSEKKFFKYGQLTGSNWYKTGHYTQMVWRKTTHVGIGKAICKDGAILIVANYSPAGNYMGEKPY
jgi:uncharacterized protein YkwD